MSKSAMRRILFAMVFVHGCATIAVETSNEDTPLRFQKVIRPTESWEYGGSAHVAGTDLVVMLQEIRQCEVITTPVVRRSKKTTKTVQPIWWQGYQVGVSPIALAVGAGLVTASLGGFMYADADNLAISNSSSDTSQKPADFRSGGAALMGLGGVLLAIGAIDALRATDSVQDLGEVSAMATREMRQCDPRPGSNVPVSLRLGDRWLARRRTGTDGRLRIPLVSMTAAAIGPGDSLEATFEDRPSVNIRLDDEVAHAVTVARASNAGAARAGQRTAEDRDPVRAVSDRPESTNGPPAGLEHDSSIVERVSDLIDKCKGTGGAGDVARAYAAYRVIEEQRPPPETKRDLEAKVIERCATNRAQAGTE